MEYSTQGPKLRIDLNGIEYEEKSLFDYFKQLNDPRKDRGKRYRLEILLVLIFLAKIGGADSPSAIADWVKARSGEIMELLHLTYPKLPHHNTYRRVFAKIVDEDVFEKMARDYIQGQIGEVEIKLLAFDGKRERGTIPPGESQGEALMAIYAPDQQVVIAQGRIEVEGEIPAAQQLLGEVDMRGKVLVGDALHTQRAISEQITQGQGDFVWTVKENQPATYQAIETLFTHPEPVKEGLDFQTFRKVNKGHGRIEERTLTVSGLLNTYLDWPGVQQVFRLERKFTFVRKGQITRVEQMVHYGLTSLSRQQASPELLLGLKRKYWQIETGLHYRRDVTFHEDATRMSHAHATRNLATIHNIILNLFNQMGLHNAAQTRRYFDANLSKAFSLLVSAHLRL